MMDCELARRLLANYLDDELTEDLAEQVQAHLIRCRDCAWEVESLKEAVGVLRRFAASSEPSLEFQQRLLSDLLREHRAAAARQPHQTRPVQRAEPAFPIILDLDKEGTTDA